MLYKNFVCLIVIFWVFPLYSSELQYKSIKKVTKEAYLRAGPGKWYPVKWILKVPGLPLRILEENGNYNFVEIYDGTKGWVSKTLISNKKYVIIIDDTKVYDSNGETKAFIKKNVVLELLSCEQKDVLQKLCKVKNQRIKGYVNEEKIWGKIRE